MSTCVPLCVSLHACLCLSMCVLIFTAVYMFCYVLMCVCMCVIAHVSWFSVCERRRHHDLHFSFLFEGLHLLILMGQMLVFSLHAIVNI